MTDDGVQAAQIAELEALYAEFDKIRRRSLRDLSLGIAALTAVYLLLVATGGGKWFWRDIAMVLGQGAAAVGGMLLCWRLDQSLRREEQDNLKWLREIARRDAVLGEMRPIMDHISSAHAMGAAAVFPVPGPGDDKPQPPSIH